MIQVAKLSYGFPEKDLFHDISFSIEEGAHCALIGSNGTGKSTLADMLVHQDKYWFDGKITLGENCLAGYAGAFSMEDKSQDLTVFEYLSSSFEQIQNRISEVCGKMAEPEADMEDLFEEYQALLDQSEAMGGEHYESTIRKQLNTAGMGRLEKTKLSEVSGGEYKLLQIMREMLLAPNLLVLDEPDMFLDFENLSGLSKLINDFKGTILVVTHNRYLLNHCFNKILHLENGDLQEFDGNYEEYRLAVLREKLKLGIQHLEEQEEIARTEEMVEILRKRATLMVNPTIGQAVNAKQSQLERLLARQIKSPFVEVPEPQIVFPKVAALNEDETEPQVVLAVKDYEIKFDDVLLTDVNFEIKEGEKVALIGANGTGKSTMLRAIVAGQNPSIMVKEGVTSAYISQFENLKCPEANLLLLDEPNAHLDLYAQSALEKALKEYKGTVLMVTHDFYLAANCADYVLLIENGTLRRIRSRNFRKMVYDKYFDSSYLEIDRKKQELETGIETALARKDFDTAGRLCSELEKYCKL